MYGEEWAEAAQVSTKTLQRFWECKPIRRGNFIAICNAIDVDWQKVIEGRKTKKAQNIAVANLRSTEIPSNLPFSDPARFVGREDDLLYLDELLTSNGQVAVCTTGMGGVGKTELALQYGRRHLHKYPGGVCWLFARTQEVGTQLVAFASRHIPDLQIPDGKPIAEQVGACFEQWLPGHVLLIFDDVENLATIRPLLPGGDRFRVILTSREKLLSRVERLELEVLSRQAALELLAVLEGEDRVKTNPAEADALCEWLGDLPLGLQLAGRYLERKPDLSLAEMLDRLKDEGLLERALAGRQDDRSQKGVAAAFQLSWEQLPQPARQVLGVMGLFAAAPVLWQLVESIWDEGLAENWRDEELLYTHLIERVEIKVYRLHALVREFVRLRFSELPDWHQKQQGFAKVLVGEAKRIEQRMTRHELEAVASVVPHIAELAEAGKEWLTDEQWIVPFTRLGWFHEGLVDYEEAERWYEICCEATRAQHNQDHIGYSTGLNNLAQLHQARGQLNHALPLALEALERDQKNLPNDHPNIAIGLSNLACLYRDLDKLEEALPFALEALKRDRQHLPENHPNIALDLNVLAVLYERLGEYAKALPLQEEALERDRKQLPDDHPNIAIYLNNLALLYRSLGKYTEAIPLLKEALERGKNTLPENHPSIASRLYNLALLHKNIGQYEEALTYAHDALARDRQNLPSDHPDVGLDLHTLACLYEATGDLEKALALFEEALSIWQRSLSPQHSDIKMGQKSVANLLLRSNDKISQKP